MNDNFFITIKVALDGYDSLANALHKLDLVDSVSDQSEQGDAVSIKMEVESMTKRISELKNLIFLVDRYMDLQYEDDKFIYGDSVWHIKNKNLKEVILDADMLIFYKKALLASDIDFSIRKVRTESDDFIKGKKFYILTVDSEEFLSRSFYSNLENNLKERDNETNYRDE